MKTLQRFLAMAALVILCHEGLAGPKAAHEQLVTQPVLPTRMQSFAPAIQPGAGQRVADDFGSSLDQRDTKAKGRFTWGILGHGVGFNKRF